MSREPILKASSRFDRKVILRSRIPTRDHGRATGDAVTDITIWAQVIENVGAEQRADGSFSQPRIRIEVNTRYRDDVRPNQQVVYGGSVYNIAGIAELGRRKGLRIACILATGEDYDG